MPSSPKNISRYTGMTLLTMNEHRDLFANAGYSDIEVVEDPGRDGFAA